MQDNNRNHATMDQYTRTLRHLSSNVQTAYEMQQQLLLCISVRDLECECLYMKAIANRVLLIYTTRLALAFMQGVQLEFIINMHLLNITIRSCHLANLEFFSKVTYTPQTTLIVEFIHESPNVHNMYMILFTMKTMEIGNNSMITRIISKRSSIQGNYLECEGLT